MKLLNLFLCLLLSGFSQYTLAQSITAHTEKFESNTVAILVQIDTIEIQDPVTDEWLIKFEKREKIQSLNGKDIYYDDEATEPVGSATRSTFNIFVSDLIREDLKSIDKIHGMDFVIDENGELGYLRLTFQSDDKDIAKAAEPTRKKIIDKLKGVHFIPAMHGDKPVPYGAGLLVKK